MPKNKQIDQVMAVAHQWLLMAVVLLPILVLFFKPTPQEALGFYLVDLVSYLIILKLDPYLYPRLFPRSSYFFPTLKPEVLSLTKLESRQEVYQEMLKFPQRRSLYIMIVSIIKVIPGFLYVYWAWGSYVHPLIIFFKGVGICAFFFSYQIALCFLQYHIMVSGILKDIHQKCNWSDVFRQPTSSVRQSIFHRVEILCGLSVWVFWVAMIVLILLDPGTPRWVAVLQAVYVSVAGLFFISRLLVIGRRQIMDGIQALVEYHQASQDKVNPGGVALSTYPIIASYQQALNQMVERNLAGEREIHRWILHRAEENRYLDLGRVSGLLVHDLITPLTVMQHCLTTIEEQPLAPGNKQTQTYLEKLRFCLNQITDLVLNVRSSIRDKTHSLKQAYPSEAHRAVVKLVSYFYEKENFNAVHISYSVPEDIIVRMPQPELNQVLLNLYSNAIHNMLSHRIEKPELQIEVVENKEDEITLSFTDNGTGLSTDTFKFLTEEAEPVSGSEGIGLKLTKRLVELYGGALVLKQSEKPSSGTQFLLSLKKPRLLKRLGE